MITYKKTMGKWTNICDIIAEIKEISKVMILDITIFLL